MVYIFSMAVAFGIAFINAMEGVGIELGDADGVGEKASAL